MSQALISLILKKGKEPTVCKSYRTITLITIDTKILSKILANCLSSVITTLIHVDQVGCIRNRFASAAISLDAEKAFDCVEWQYLFQVLEISGFGQTFLKWVKLLYIECQAAIQTNGIMSSYFRLGRLFQDWLREVGKVAAFERISYSIIYNIDKYNEKRAMFLSLYSIYGS